MFRRWDQAGLPGVWEQAGAACLLILDSVRNGHFLGIETPHMLEKSTFLGAICEGYVIAEVMKNRINAGRRREAYYFRDKDGLEVDLVLPQANARWDLVEIKSSHSATVAMAHGIQRVREAMGDKFAGGCVVYREGKTPNETQAMLPGIRALTYPQFLTEH